MKINKVDLQIALEMVKPGLANKDVIEQATSFAFINDRVVTFNNEISMSYPVAGMNLKGAVKAEELYQLLHKLKGEEIEVELTDTEILFTSDRSKAGMILQTEIKMPLDEVGETSEWLPIPEDFLEALKFAVPSCSTASNRPTLTTVHVKDDLVEATDAYRISRFTLKEPMPVAEFLLPSSSAKQVLKIKPNKMCASQGWVHFMAGEVTLSCRVFMDTYPSLEAIVAQKGKEMTLPQSTVDVLERSSVFSNKMYGEEVAHIKIEKNKLKIRSESEVGWFEEDLNFRYTGEAINFSVIPSLLKNILTETQTCEVCERVIIFKGENWLYLSLLRETKYE